MTDFAKLVLDADTKGLKRGERDLDDMGRTAGKTANTVDRSNRTMGGSFSSLARTGILPLIATTASAYLSISSLISTNAEFGASMQKVAAISGATGAELAELRDTAKELGATTQFSASEAADALGFLSMAGFEASESVKALPSVLSLAAAGALDLASAADIASNVLSGFGKNAKEAGVVADVLAVAASSSNTSVQQLGGAMSTVAPIAAALSISMEETAAAIGVMSDAGIQGERAGTALRGVFASLAGPTTQAQAALAKYGLTASQVNPETSSLATILDRLSEAGISTADAMTIFGREAASGALAMISASERVRELTGELQNAEGAAAEMAKTMNDNLGGDIKALKSAVEGLVIGLGEQGATGTFRSLAQTATTALRAITSNLSTFISVTSTAVVGLAAYKAAMLAGSAATALGTTNLRIYMAAVSTTTARVGLMAGAQVALTGATAGVTAAMRTLFATMMANPLTAIAIGVGAVTAAMYGLAQSQREARAETNNLITSLRALASARSADFASKRNEAQQQRNKAYERLSRLEGGLARRRSSPELAQRPGAGAIGKGVTNEIYAARMEVVRLDAELGAADRAFKGASSAAEAMVVPTAQVAATASTASTNIGGITSASGGAASGMSEAAKSADRLSQSFMQLSDRLFPKRARFAEYLEDLRTLRNSQDATADHFARLRNEFMSDAYGDPKVVTKAYDDLAQTDAAFQKRNNEFRNNLSQMVGHSEVATVRVAKSFKDMADNTLAALDRVSSAIQGGGFLSILSSVVGLGLQLGSVGLFGKSVQANINATPGRANGGAVSAGQSYLVGENRPEIFTPNQNGFITPNAGNDNGPARVEIVDTTGLFRFAVNGQIQEAAPAIVDGGAKVANSRAARRQSRMVR